MKKVFNLTLIKKYDIIQYKEKNKEFYNVKRIIKK